MKTTLSIIKADTGSVGGHNKPSEPMIAKAKEQVAGAIASGLISDARVTFTGDDIALLMTHGRGVDNPDIHKLAWDTFVATTAIAKSQGLYGAGQDLLADAFSCNVRGMGPGVAEMDFSMFKNTAISERFRLQFRAEFFNVMNHANFGSPSPVVFSGNAYSSSAGLITGTTTTSRQIQFGLKLVF